MGRESDTSCLIPVGATVIELRCPTAGHAAAVRQYFGLPVVRAEPDVRLTLRLTGNSLVPSIPDSFLTTKQVGPEGFAIAGNLVRGHFDPVGGEGELAVNCALTSGPVMRVFEQLLYQAFYSARAIAGYDAVLVHSSSVLREGAGFLFAGPSGSGKSTVAGLSAAYRILNDEISLLSFTDDGVVLHGTPFNGSFTEKQAGCAPLQAVLLLRHGPGHHLEEVRRADAVRVIVKEIIPPIGLDERLTGRTYGTMLDCADRLAGAVPVRYLEFRRDAGFWDVLDRAFMNAEVSHGEPAGGAGVSCRSAAVRRSPRSSTPTCAEP